jgi:hypothetical protein
MPPRFSTFLIGLTGSASLIGAITVENAEFSQAYKRAHQVLDFGGRRGLEITA